MRYCGLYSACGRDTRLKRCRELMGIATEMNLESVERTSSCADKLLPEPDEEDQPLTTSCSCRYCQAELMVVGRLQGTPTLRLMALARAVLPILTQLCGWVTDELLSQPQSGTLDLTCLPSSLRTLLAGKWLGTLEYCTLAALLHRPTDSMPSAQGGQHHSGIPPPQLARVHTA